MKFSIKSILLSCFISGILVFVLAYLFAIVGGLLFGKEALMSLPEWTGAFVWIPLALFHGRLLHRFAGPEKFFGTVVVSVGVLLFFSLFEQHAVYNVSISLFLGLLFFLGGTIRRPRV